MGGFSIGYGIGIGPTSRGFSPLSIGGLQLWLDATTGLFDATSGGNAVTTDGSAVARWEDQSGNSRHITQGTLANRPLLKTAVQNSKNIVRFDGTDDVMTRSSFLFSQGLCTVFVAMKSNCAAGRWLLSETSTSNNTPVYGLIVSLNANSLKFSSFARNDSNAVYLSYPDNGTAFDNSFRLIAVADSGSNTTAYINKSETTSTNYTRSTTTINTFCVGAWQRTSLVSPWAGDVAEIIIYDSVLSSSDRGKVDDYLYAKWAIS